MGQPVLCFKACSKPSSCATQGLSKMDGPQPYLLCPQRKVLAVLGATCFSMEEKRQPSTVDSLFCTDLKPSGCRRHPESFIKDRSAFGSQHMARHRVLFDSIVHFHCKRSALPASARIISVSFDVLCFGLLFRSVACFGKSKQTWVGDGGVWGTPKVSQPWGQGKISM